MRIFVWILAGCMLLAAGYSIWGYTGKNYSDLQPASVSIRIASFGADVGNGNLLAIQPYLTAADYCDQQHFYRALHLYFAKAKAAGLLQQNTVAVLPEDIGTWLVLANEKTSIYQSDSVKNAVATIVNSNIFKFIRNLITTSAGDRIKHAFVYMKADSMIRIYTAVFSSLAKDFHVTIAAGSIILPQPALDATGKIYFQKGRLYYSAFIFDPQGKIQAGPVLKMLPVYDSGNSVASDTSLYMTAATPAGKVMVTADDNSSADLSYKKGKVMAVIFMTGDDKIWNAVWKGAQGFAVPTDAVTRTEDRSFLKRIMIREQTSSQLLPSVPGERTVIHNGFAGNLWEISYQNRLSVVRPMEPMLDLVPVKQQGVIVNTWFH